MTDITILSPELPRPVDDGACAHLPGMKMPDITLPSTAGVAVKFRELPPGRTVIYCYPMTGVPGKPLPRDWDLIPGARGCTPQACSFRDNYQELQTLGAGVFGLSTQTTGYQREMAERLNLPFPILSDAELRFATALRLPMFEPEGMTLIKRLTLVVNNGIIEHVFYPVFPPDQSASDVIRWLQETEHPKSSMPSLGER
jgi:peroxiredoxin